MRDRRVFGTGCRWLAGAVLLAHATVSLLAATAYAADPQAVLDALRNGGHVLYFRHAATDWSQSDRVQAPGDWASCDPERMRQLSAAGRETARAVGAAIRRLGIPVERVHTSEYCRCVQTAELLGLGPVSTTRDLLNTQAAQYIGGYDALTRTARRRLSTPPPPGTNTVLVAHGNVFMLVADRRPPEGGAVVIRPLGQGRFDIVDVLAARDWTALAETAPSPEPRTER